MSSCLGMGSFYFTYFFSKNTFTPYAKSAIIIKSFAFGKCNILNSFRCSQDDVM